MMFIRKYAWDQQVGKKERSRKDTVSVEASANPPGCSEDGMTL